MGGNAKEDYSKHLLFAEDPLLDPTAVGSLQSSSAIRYITPAEVLINIFCFKLLFNVLFVLQDELIKEGVSLHAKEGYPNWGLVGEHAGLSGSQVAKRWHDHLRPELADCKKDPWTESEVFVCCCYCVLLYHCIC